MSGGSQLDFYRARAAQARADADTATLQHVKERCLRSEEAWTQLANRAARAEDMRAKEALRKAEVTA
jgi:hypothetical protein